MGRGNGVPGMEPGIVDALLGILADTQDAVGDGAAVAAVAMLGGGNGRLVTGFIQGQNVLVGQVLVGGHGCTSVADWSPSPIRTEKGARGLQVLLILSHFFDDVSTVSRKNPVKGLHSVGECAIITVIHKNTIGYFCLAGPGDNCDVTTVRGRRVEFFSREV